MKTSITSLLTIASLFAFGSSEAGGNRCGNNCNLVEVLSGYSDFSALVAAVKAAGLVDTLVGPGPFTVFAPTDSVFKSLPPATLIAVASDPPTLKTLLLRHVIPGSNIFSKDIPVGKTTLPTAAPGESITIVNQGGHVTVSTSGGSASVTHVDIGATNGVAHVISGLL